MPSVVTEHLRDRGPATRSTLPSDPTNIPPRREGVTRFSVSRRSATGSGPSIGGEVTPVWYLRGEHDPEAVVRAFYDANPQLVRSASVRQAHQLIAGRGERWRAASAAVTPEVFGADAWRSAFDPTE
jgi:hypothetical protein